MPYDLTIPLTPDTADAVSEAIVDIDNDPATLATFQENTTGNTLLTNMKKSGDVLPARVSC